jgi:4-amino-4-deoxy-L-arabinose transferase-like glycosyltransferase
MSNIPSSSIPEQSYRPPASASRVDITGIALLIAAAISLLVGVIAVSTIYSWDAPQTLGSFLAAGEFIVLFLINEQFVNYPIFPLNKHQRSKASSSPTLIADRLSLASPNLILVGILLLAAYLNLCQITQNDLGNIYYASTVKSMSMSWHNFFFVAFEPSGFIAMDKPPVSLWLQTISVKLFGFNGVSLALPLILAGIVSITILFHLVRRSFGPKAGLLAAFFLALTPVSVVTSRATTMDGMLTLDLLCAAWATLKAAETGRLRWLLLGFALIGLGYNIKMMEAFLVLPAFIFLYLLAAPRLRLMRIGHIALALIALLVVSFSWSLIVDSVAASQRPFVGSSGNNTEIGLGLGYNGVGRPVGQILALALSGVSKSSSTANMIGEIYTLSGGITRLFTYLGDQVNWLLPLALLGILTTIWHRADAPEATPPFKKHVVSRTQQSLICWGGWFLVQALFFTVYVLIHNYYLTIFAPSVAALAGIGMIGLWHDYQKPGWRGWLLPIALLLAAFYQTTLVFPFSEYRAPLLPLIVLALLLATGLLVWQRLIRRGATAFPSPQAPLSISPGRFNVRAHLTPATIAVTIGLIAVLLAPTTWSLATTLHAANGLVPVAGPDRTGKNDPFVYLTQGVSEYAEVDPKLITYLETHRGNAHYLVATSTSLAAAPFVIQTSQAVLPIGGFNGNDNIFTSDQLAQLVQSGQVKYFWLAPFFISDAQINQLDPRLQQIMRELAKTQSANPNNRLIAWVSSHCALLSTSAWGGSGSTDEASGGQPQLYDCTGNQ